MFARIMLYVMLAVIGVWLVSGVAYQYVQPIFAEKTFKIHLAHTGDLQGHIQKSPADGGFCLQGKGDPDACLGGFPRLKLAFDRLTDVHPDVALLDSGDFFQGSLFYSTYKSKALAPFMNMMPYTAVVLGNHEFDDGIPEIMAFAEYVGFPLLATNIRAEDHHPLKPYLRTHVIKNFDGHNVGFIGLSTPETPKLVSKAIDLEFEDPIKAARREVAVLARKGVDIVVVVSHLGMAQDQDLARAVPEIDVILGGYDDPISGDGQGTYAQQAYPLPVHVNGKSQSTLLAYAPPYGHYLGFLELEFDTHQALIGWEGQLIAMNKDVPSFEAFARMVHTLARPLENVHEIMMGTVQHTAANRNCRKEFCSEGRMVADAMLATFSPQGADIALFNGGGLRHTVEAGPIFQADLKALLPFGDQISTFDLTGKQIRETLEQALIGGGRFPHIAGLRVAWSVPVAKAPHAVIDTLDVLQEGRWQPVKDTATYTLATNSFLRKGGDGYSHFKKSASNVQDTSIKVLDVVLSYVRSRLVLDLGDDGRLQHKTTGHTGAQP